MRTFRNCTIYFLLIISLLFLILHVPEGIADIIIDNGNPGTFYTGTWGVSGGTTPYGTNSLWARDGATYTWQFSSQPAGVYEVYMWWSGYGSRATNIAVTINHSNGSQVVNINQQKNAGQWNSLGQYSFNSSGSVTITAAYGSTVSTCADAVWFKLVSSNTPPTAYIDSITPNPAEPGQTVEFQGHGTDDGSVVAYQWESNINGLLSNLASFSTSSLSAGTHTITFKVQDNEGVWSAPVTQSIVVGTIPTEIIIDNRDAGTSKTGTWGVSSAANPYGTDSVWSRDGTTFTWYFTPPKTGNYELSMWWTYWSSRSTSVPVDIEYSGGTTRVYINQQQNGGKWNVLGSYPFTAGVSYKITITAQPGPSSTCADAVRFVYVGSGGNVPPVAVIDSISPNPALPGETVTFIGHGTDTDGTITGYSWRSSVDGVLSYSSTFSSATLSEGIHVIYLKVQDNNGAWSPEVSKTLSVTDQSSNTEHIYACLFYDVDKKAKEKFIATLQSIGAKQEGDVWKYTNSGQGKDYIIHIVGDIEGTKQAFYTKNAHIIMKGHANYGLGAAFVTPEQQNNYTANDILSIDDPKILNYSTPWIAVSVSGMITGQKYPNWWPIFQDGTSGSMPFDFGDPRGDPPYNYYITYQVPGDPTYYKVETVNNSARERFSDSGRPAWYSPDGTKPSPVNTDHLQYYITNPGASVDPNILCGSRVCPPVHYGHKTILFRKELEIEVEKLNYKRMLFDSCNVGVYFVENFHRGITFFTVASSNGGGVYLYLKAYLEGKSDAEIWKIMQTSQPVYDYYNFDKRPSEQ